MINKLKRHREKKQWSIPELSEKSQVPTEIIKQLEELESFESIGGEIDPKHVIAVAMLFGAPETEIFVPDEKPEMPRFYLDII